MANDIYNTGGDVAVQSGVGASAGQSAFSEEQRKDAQLFVDDLFKQADEKRELRNAKPIDPLQFMPASTYKPGGINVSYTGNTDERYVRLNSGKYIPRYKDFIPGTNNEDRLARSQSWAEQLMNGFAKMNLKVGTYTIQSVLEPFVGGAYAIAGRDWSKYYDNDFMRLFDDWHTRMDNSEWGRNYYRDGEREKQFWQRLGTANFWADDIMGNVPFTVAAINTEVIYAAATGGVSLYGAAARWGARALLKKGAKEVAEAGVRRMAQGARIAGEMAEDVGKAGGRYTARGARIAGEMAEDVGKTGGRYTARGARIAGEMAEDVGKAGGRYTVQGGRIAGEGAEEIGEMAARRNFGRAPWNFTPLREGGEAAARKFSIDAERALGRQVRATAKKQIDNELDDLIKAMNKPMIAAKVFNNIRSLGTTAGFEAAVESYDMMKTARQDFIAAYERTHGRAPSSKEMGDFEDALRPVGNSVYFANVGIVGLSNILMFGKMFGLGADLGIKKGINRALFGVGTKMVNGVATPLKRKLGHKVAGYALGVGKNMFSEGLWEEGTQSVAHNAAEEYMRSHFSPDHTRKNMSVMDAIRHGYGAAYGTKEGWDEVGVGMIIGGLFGGVTGGLTSARQAAKANSVAAANYNALVQGSHLTPSPSPQEGGEGNKESEGAVVSAMKGYILGRLNGVRADTGMRAARLNAQMTNEVKSGESAKAGDIAASQHYGRMAMFAYMHGLEGVDMLDDATGHFGRLIDNMSDEELGKALGYSEEEIKGAKEKAKEAFAGEIETYKKATRFADMLIGEGMDGYELSKRAVAQNVFLAQGARAEMRRVGELIGEYTGEGRIADALAMRSRISSAQSENFGKIAEIDGKIDELSRRINEVNQTRRRDLTPSPSRTSPPTSPHKGGEEEGEGSKSGVGDSVEAINADIARMNGELLSLQEERQRLYDAASNDLVAINANRLLGGETSEDATEWITVEQMIDAVKELKKMDGIVAALGKDSVTGRRLMDLAGEYNAQVRNVRAYEDFIRNMQDGKFMRNKEKGLAKLLSDISEEAKVESWKNSRDFSRLGIYKKKGLWPFRRKWIVEGNDEALDKSYEEGKITEEELYTFKTLNHLIGSDPLIGAATVEEEDEAQAERDALDARILGDHLTPDPSPQGEGGKKGKDLEDSENSNNFAEKRENENDKSYESGTPQTDGGASRTDRTDGGGTRSDEERRKAESEQGRAGETDREKALRIGLENAHNGRSILEDEEFTDSSILPATTTFIKDGINFGVYEKAGTEGTTSIYLAYFPNGDLVSYKRVFDINGNPTNTFEIIANLSQTDRATRKRVFEQLAELLPENHRITETNSASIDGLRFILNQEKQGYRRTGETTMVELSIASRIEGVDFLNEEGAGTYDTALIKKDDYAKVKAELDKLGIESFFVSSMRNEAEGKVYVYFPVMEKTGRAVSGEVGVAEGEKGAGSGSMSQNENDGRLPDVNVNDSRDKGSDNISDVQENGDKINGVDIRDVLRRYDEIGEKLVEGEELTDREKRIYERYKDDIDARIEKIRIENGDRARFWLSKLRERQAGLSGSGDVIARNRMLIDEWAKDNGVEDEVREFGDLDWRIQNGAVADQARNDEEGEVGDNEGGELTDEKWDRYEELYEGLQDLGFERGFENVAELISDTNWMEAHQSELGRTDGSGQRERVMDSSPLADADTNHDWLQNPEVAVARRVKWGRDKGNWVVSNIGVEELIGAMGIGADAVAGQARNDVAVEEGKGYVDYMVEIGEGTVVRLRVIENRRRILVSEADARTISANTRLKIAEIEGGSRTWTPVVREVNRQESTDDDVSQEGDKSGTGATAEEIAMLKADVLQKFWDAVNGKFTGKGIQIGLLTEAGKRALASISGLDFKDITSFELNPSDLVHIYNDHYGKNEKAPHQNNPLTDSDIERLVDVLYSPDTILSGTDQNTGLKVFAFLKANENGTYNVMEIYGNSGGRLTTKSFYNTKAGIAQRVMDLQNPESSQSLLPTSATYSGASLSGANIPHIFDILAKNGEKNENGGENVGELEYLATGNGYGKQIYANGAWTEYIDKGALADVQVGDRLTLRVDYGDSYNSGLIEEWERHLTPSPSPQGEGGNAGVADAERKLREGIVIKVYVKGSDGIDHLVGVVPSYVTPTSPPAPLAPHPQPLSTREGRKSVAISREMGQVMALRKMAVDELKKRKSEGLDVTGTVFNMGVDVKVTGVYAGMVNYQLAGAGEAIADQARNDGTGKIRVVRHEIRGTEAHFGDIKDVGYLLNGRFYLRSNMGGATVIDNGEGVQQKKGALNVDSYMRRMFASSENERGGLWGVRIPVMVIEQHGVRYAYPLGLREVEDVETRRAIDELMSKRVNGSWGDLTMADVDVANEAVMRRKLGSHLYSKDVGEFLSKADEVMDALEEAAMQPDVTKWVDGSRTMKEILTEDAETDLNLDGDLFRGAKLRVDYGVAAIENGEWRIENGEVADRVRNDGTGAKADDVGRGEKSLDWLESPHPQPSAHTSPPTPLYRRGENEGDKTGASRGVRERFYAELLRAIGKGGATNMAGYGAVMPHIGKLNGEQIVRFFEYLSQEDGVGLSFEELVNNRVGELERRRSLDIQGASQLKALMAVKNAFETDRKLREMAKQEAERAQRAADEAARQAELAKSQDERGKGITERWAKGKKVWGKADSVILPNGKVLAGRWVLVESGTATPSHDPRRNFAPSEGFWITPEGRTVNDRDYEKDKAAQASVLAKAQKYDQRALGSTRDVPIIDPSGIVLSGNDRTMAGEIAAANGTDGAYLAYLRQHYTEKNLPEGALEGFEHPRLLFVLDEAQAPTTETFAMFNARETKSQNKTESAKKVGKVISAAALQDIINVVGEYSDLEGLYGSEDGTKRLIDALRGSGALNQNDIEQYTDTSGGILRFNKAGEEYVETVLVGAVLDEDAVVALSVMADVRRTMVSAIGGIAQAKNLEGGFSLGGEISAAIRLIKDSRRKTSDGKYIYGDAEGNGRIDDYLGQKPLQFSGDPNDVYEQTTILTAKLLAKDGRLGLKKSAGESQISIIRSIFEAYNRSAVSAASGQMSLYDDGTTTKEGILNLILERYGYRTGQGTGGEAGNAVGGDVGGNRTGANRGGAAVAEQGGRDNSGVEQAEWREPGDVMPDEVIEEVDEALNRPCE